MIVDTIQSRAGFEMTNTLDIAIRQKADSVLSWVNIDATTGLTVNFDLCPPIGTYTLVLETYDKNSALGTPAALETDTITITVTQHSNLVAA